MRKMSYCDTRLLIHIGEERSLVVYAECEDSMLIWQGERGTENSAVGSLRNGMEG